MESEKCLLGIYVPATFHFQFSARRMLLPSIGAQHHKKSLHRSFPAQALLIPDFPQRQSDRPPCGSPAGRHPSIRCRIPAPGKASDHRDPTAPSPDPPASRCLALRGSRRMPAAHKEIRGSFQKPWITPPPCELPATSIQALTGKCKRQAHGIRQKFPLRIGRCFQPARTSTFRTPST